MIVLRRIHKDNEGKDIKGNFEQIVHLVIEKVESSLAQNVHMLLLIFS